MSSRTGNLSKFVDHYLQLHMHYLPSHVKDIPDFISNVRDIQKDKEYDISIYGFEIFVYQYS